MSVNIRRYDLICVYVKYVCMYVHTIYIHMYICPVNILAMSVRRYMYNIFGSSL